MAHEIQFQIKAHFDELPTLTEKMNHFLETHAASGETVFAADLAVEELVTNIVKYGYDDTREHFITIGLILTEKELALWIEDDGHEFNPFDLPEPDTSLALEEREEGGLGIHFVRNLLDECKYERIGSLNRITLLKNFGS